MSTPPLSSHLSNTTFSSSSSFLFSSLQPSSSLLAHLSSSLSSSPPSYPFYHSSAPSLIPGLADKHLALAAPIIAYWVFASVFHVLDVMEWPYFEKRRIHESEDVTRRNRVGLGDLLKNVLLQHFIQTLTGLLWMSFEPEHPSVDHASVMISSYAPRVAQAAILLLGKINGEDVLRKHGREIVEFVYWWGVPIAQFGLAFFIIDTWQFFLHKLMHEVPYLYRNFHSHHHRLYVPYAFGALYNHPLEGFLLDSGGALLAESLSGMTIRQSAALFAFSSLKTVDDHSGYRIWWDPMQMLFANNADFHDIHHQSFGIKSNFSQPFFTRWDHLFGTVMTREQVANRKRPVGSNAVAEILAVEKEYKIE